MDVIHVGENAMFAAVHCAQEDRRAAVRVLHGDGRELPALRGEKLVMADVAVVVPNMVAEANGVVALHHASIRETAEPNNLDAGPNERTRLGRIEEDTGAGGLYLARAARAMTGARVGDYHGRGGVLAGCDGDDLVLVRGGGGGGFVVRAAEEEQRLRPAHAASAHTAARDTCTQTTSLATEEAPTQAANAPGPMRFQQCVGRCACAGIGEACPLARSAWRAQEMIVTVMM